MFDPEFFDAEFFDCFEGEWVAPRRHRLLIRFSGSPMGYHRRRRRR